MIGVLALQGGVREHVEALSMLGVKAIEVKTPEQLSGLNGLVIPGGESTNLRKLIARFGLKEKIVLEHEKGMALFGTCAGAIVLSKKIEGEKPFIPALGVTAKRNSYGRQLDSFEAMVSVKGIGKDFPAVFIRAPEFTAPEKSVEVLAEFNGKPVLLREGNVLLSSFHPELTKDTRVHELFLKIAGEKKKK
ncbi:MAG: pyridoxal 5'-phosphate synthase glutaminase subunit PdxT [Candidatus Diapherotrites archaeon]